MKRKLDKGKYVVYGCLTFAWLPMNVKVYEKHSVETYKIWLRFYWYTFSGKIEDGSMGGVQDIHLEKPKYDTYWFPPNILDVMLLCMIIAGLIGIFT